MHDHARQTPSLCSPSTTTKVIVRAHVGRFALAQIAQQGTTQTGPFHTSAAHTGSPLHAETAIAGCLATPTRRQSSNGSGPLMETRYVISTTRCLRSAAAPLMTRSSPNPALSHTSIGSIFQSNADPSLYQPVPCCLKAKNAHKISRKELTKLCGAMQLDHFAGMHASVFPHLLTHLLLSPFWFVTQVRFQPHQHNLSLRVQGPGDCARV